MPSSKPIISYEDGHDVSMITPSIIPSMPLKNAMPQWFECPPNERSDIEDEISAKPESKKKIARITVIVAKAGDGSKRKIIPKINAIRPPPSDTGLRGPDCEVTPPNKAIPPTKRSNQPMSSTIASAAIPGRTIAKKPSAIKTMPSTINHFQLIIEQ